METLIESIIQGTIDPKQAGRTFFSGNFSKEQTAQFLNAYLERARYEDLAIAIHCGLISKEYNHADYWTANTGAQDLDARYFQLLLELCQKASIHPDRLVPLMVAVFSCPHDSELFAWRHVVEAYLLGEAYRDYDRILGLLTEFDPFYTAYGVLMTANRKRTEQVLVERLLYGDGKKINFTAIRKLLLACKIDVSYLFGPGYPDKELKVREAIVRLALLYKNDPKASAFLQRVRQNEQAGRILRLVEKKESKHQRLFDPKEELEFQMIAGGRIEADEMMRRLGDAQFNQICERLFFSVYAKEGTLTSIVVVHEGRFCDLDNVPYTFLDGALIGVTHPIELPPAYEFIQHLNLPEQPFLQMHRPVYHPDAFERAANVVARLNGTVMTAASLRQKLKACGFSLLRGRSDEPFFSHAALTLSPYACVLSFAPTDFTDKDFMVRLGDAKFYVAQDFVRLNGKTYIEGAPLVRIAELPTRLFSEFIYALCRIAKATNE